MSDNTLIFLVILLFAVQWGEPDLIDAMVASQHNHDFIEILEIISETEIKVRNTEELLNS